MNDIMKNQAGSRAIGIVWIKDNYDGEVVKYSSHFGSEDEFKKYCASKIEGFTTRSILKTEYNG